MLKEIIFTKGRSLKWSQAFTLAKMLGCMVMTEDRETVTMTTFNGDHVIVEDIITEAGGRILSCKDPF